MNGSCSPETESGHLYSLPKGVCVSYPFHVQSPREPQADRPGSFLLAFSTRAGVDVLLMLFRTWRKRKIRIAMIRHAIFGAVPLRFGAMIGELLHRSPAGYTADIDRYFYLSKHTYAPSTSPRPAHVIYPKTYTSWTICEADVWSPRT